MHKLLAWLGAATLVVSWSVSAQAGTGTALKPYIVLILDTSGSMTGSTGSGPPSCGGSDTKIDHARCAINNIVNSYGDIVFAFAKFRETPTGTFSTSCAADCNTNLYVDCSNCTASTGAGCTAAGNADNLFQMVTSLQDGNNQQTATYTDFQCNSCAEPFGPQIGATNPEIMFANSWTPLNGSFKGDKRYWLGQQASDGTTLWPSNLPGFNPIVNDPTNAVFLPSGCNPSPTCTTNCCQTQCRPYITIMLTDGDETCSLIDNNWPTVSTLLDTEVSTGSPATLKKYRVETYAIGFGTPVPYAQIENITHAGGHTDVPGVNEGFYASDEAGLELAISKIIEGSIRTELCNNLDDDCDGAIDEDFPNKGAACDDGKLGICKGTGTLGCKADGTGLQCNITNPGGNPQTTCPPGKTCNGDGSETCGDNLDNDCDGAVDEGCTACVPVGEICNNKDDDCDGIVDEGLSRQCGTGVCLGTETCTAGVWGGCTATQPQPETCNNKDDDCDGAIDEDLTRPCGNIACPGVEVCSAGVWGACNAQQGTTEICNGLDDDCDGAIDEDFQSQPCSTNCGTGMTQCIGGTITCNAQPSSSDATCNNIDDDCDGMIDEDWKCNDPSSVPFANCACGQGVVCNGMAKCVNGTVQCVGDPINQETCNCKDDDCDGTVDEGSTCPSGATCTNCQCAFPCSGGEFPCPLGKKCDMGFCINDPCYGVTCNPDGQGNAQECIDQNNNGVCVTVCSQTTCPAGFVCIGSTGMCKPNDCTTFPNMCTPDQDCVVDQNGHGQCVTNPCKGVQCPQDQYCVSGNCVASCADVTCPPGQRCRLGQCETDPCGHPCPSGEVCNDQSGQCVGDPCKFQQCPQGQWCNPNDGGQCEPDPCVGTMCPGMGQVCKGGTCYNPGQFLPDAGVETHVTVGGGGCSTGGGSGLSIALALLALRRRRSGGHS